jgi:hypothetical protein
MLPIAIHHQPIFPQGPLSVSPSCMQSHDLSLHFLEILALGLSSILCLGTRFPNRNCGTPWWRCSLWVLHISLSPEELIFQGCPPYLS